MKLKAALTGVALVGLSLAATGCSSDSKSSSTTTTTTAKDAACADKTALEGSVKTLTNPSTLSGGKSAITDAVDQVKNDLDALGSSVEDSLQPQVDDMKSAVDDVESAVQSLGSDPSAEGLQEAGDAIAKVGTSAGKLESSLTTRCPAG
jgi:hypothetical protein